MDTSKLFDLKGKTAIITGGANGIGKASCEMLAAFGANVVVSDYNLDDAKKTAKEIIDKGGKAIAIDCDVTKDKALVNLVNKSMKEYGGIHILVNNVGGGGAGKESPYDIEVEQFKKVFEMNVFSMWRLCQLVAPHMKKAGYGSIINMSSMASVNKSPAISAYASSKAAINHMTRNLAFDYGPDEIRINAIGTWSCKNSRFEYGIDSRNRKENVGTYTNQTFRRTRRYCRCCIVLCCSHFKMDERTSDLS